MRQNARNAAALKFRDVEAAYNEIDRKAPRCELFCTVWRFESGADAYIV
jgi:hypothetical protein